LTKTVVGLVNRIKVVETVRESPQHLHLWLPALQPWATAAFWQAIDSKNR
jgi:hypothetical protein